MNFSGIFGHILGTTGLILSFLILPQHNPAATPHAQVTPVAPVSYVATKQYTYEGHTATIHFSIPKSGGDVTGTISGDCNGNITGTYDGGDNGKINGNIQTACQVYFFSIPATGTYSGVVHTEDKTVDLTVDVKADGFEKTQQVSLPLH